MAALPRRIHWLVPTTMFGFLLASVLLALGHHLFYRNLAGTPPPSYSIPGLGVSRQEINLAVGSTFANLVRSCLGFAVSLAYVQLVWHTTKRSKRDIHVADLDKALSARSDFLVILNVRAWCKWPLVFVVAAVTWLLPIITVITPATLTVGQAIPSPRLLDVPNVAMTSVNLADVSLDQSGWEDQTYTVTADIYAYRGPSEAVNSIANTVAAQGQLLTVSPPARNASWAIRFNAPAISCNNASSELVASISASIAGYINASLTAYASGDRGSSHIDAPIYAAWTPPMHSGFSSLIASDTNSIIPFVDGAATQNLSQASYNYEQYDLGDSTPLFVALVPGILNFNSEQGTIIAFDTTYGSVPQAGDLRSMADIYNLYVLPNLTILQCNAFNATYDVNFDSTDGIQSVRRMTTSSSLFRTVGRAYTSSFVPGNTAYPSCKGFHNTSNNGPFPIDSGNTPESYVDAVCSFDSSTLSAFSYQAILDSFNSIVRGTIVRDVVSSPWTAQTVVDRSVLSRSPELASIIGASLHQNGDWAPGMGSLQDELLNQFPEHPGYYTKSSDTSPALPLADALEELFQNITISLASSEALQPNKSSPFFPPPANVAFATISNVYEYSQKKLWLAYGIAIGVSLAAVVVGLVVMWLNDAAYNNSFSSLLRLSRGAQLNRKIVPKDYDGREPLPKYLEKGVIRFAEDPKVGRTSKDGTVYAPLDIVA